MDSNLPPFLIREIRGSKSQAWINRRLGYRSNVVSQWESSQRDIPWKQFVKLCEIRNIMLARTLDNFIGFTDSPSRFDLIINHIGVQVPFDQMQAHTGCSAATLRRWSHGNGSPSLNLVLKLFQLVNGGSELFLCLFCRQNNLNLPDGVKESSSRSRELMESEPVVAAIRASLEIDEYRALKNHSNALISRIVGAKKDKVKRLLMHLEWAGQVKRDKGKFFEPDSPTVRTELSSRTARQNIIAYWYERVAKSLRAGKLFNPGQRAVVPYFVHPLSREAAESIRQEIRKLYLKVDRIIQNDRHSKKGVFLVQLGFCDVSDLDEEEAR